jgi:hypothetical protein
MSSPRPTSAELQAFVDGELSPAEVDRVGSALAADPELAAELDEALQVRALAADLGAAGWAPHPDTERAAAGPPVPPPADRDRAHRSRRRPWLVAVPAALAAALAGYCAARGPGPDSRGPGSVGAEPQVVAEALAAALRPTRGLAPRLAYPGADRHRAYDTVRASGAARPAGDPEAISFDLLARLERLSDPRALVAAHVLTGATERATQLLDRAAESADEASDRAALALLGGDAEGALLAADRALARAPEHRPAAWNRALALSALGLDRSASAAFSQLAAAGEPGWSAEATARAAALADQRAREDDAYRGAAGALREMLHGGPPPIAASETAPGLARLYLYDAVRAAPDAERVRALAPLARALDAQAGDDALARHVARVAALPFARRAPLAARYAALLSSAPADRAAEAATLLGPLRAAGPAAADLLLGALLFAGPGSARVAAGDLAEYARVAAATDDPWFLLLAEEQRAATALAAADVTGAEQILRAAAARCATPAAPAYRCQRIARLQVHAYLVLHRTGAARAAWAASRRAALAGGSRDQADELWWFAGRIAGLEDTVEGRRLPVARAYLDEWARAGGDCARQRGARETTAQALINGGRIAEAREVIVGVPPCDAPPTLEGAFVAAQLLDPAAGAADTPEVREASAAARAAVQRMTAQLRAGEGAPGVGALLDHIDGRSQLGAPAPADRAAARARLRALVAAPAAIAGAADPYAAQARAYSAAVLVEDAGARGDWGEALALLALERGAPVPSRCALGASAERAAVFVARDPSGAVTGARIELAPDRMPSDVEVPPELIQRLAGCELVDVLARQPYYGRPGLLPAALAHRFRWGAAPSDPGDGPTLVVGNVAAPPALGLSALAPIAAPADATFLEGAAATPARVLGALRRASFAELHSHGLVGHAGGVSHGGDDGAALVLSPDAAGRYALTAREVAGARLAGRPVVVLAACDAARLGRAFHTTWGLADALLAAGASAVIASPAAIADAAAPRFFAAVRARIAAGTPPAVALRDERVAWSDPAQRTWIDQLVVFQ